MCNTPSETGEAEIVNNSGKQGGILSGEGTISPPASNATRVRDSLKFCVFDIIENLQGTIILLDSTSNMKKDAQNTFR